MSIKDFAQRSWPKMNPRAARSDDAPAIARVHVAAWRTTYRGIVADEVLDGLSTENQTREWIRILGDADHQTFVVEDSGGDIMGFANCGPERRGNLGFAGELYAIYLLDDYRGRGIGTTLFRQSAAALLASGMDGMMVWSMKANPYRRFYEALGGSHFRTDTVEFCGQNFTEYAYGWQNLKAVLAKELP